MTPLAVALIAIWMIVTSQGPVSSTFTLIVGLVSLLLVLADLAPWRRLP